MKPGLAHSLCASALALTVALLPACAGEADTPPGPDPDGIGSYALSGTALDFETTAALSGAATISTSGIQPAPSVSTTGADFTIEGIPPFSAFHILAGSPPDYRSTYNMSTTVEDEDVDGVTVLVVSEAYVTRLLTAFAITPQPGTGIVIARAIDTAGAGKAGVPAEAFALDAAARGPYFLDMAKSPAPAADATTSSGWLVFFDVAPGLVTPSAAAGSGYSISGAAAPVAQNVVTLAEVVVSEGPPPAPTNVSFAGDVFPIFARRGCQTCHSGNGIGRDLGNLTLDGSTNLVHRELTEEISPNFGVLRIDLQDPARSLVLTMPSFESPPDPHPNATFTSDADPDYQILLAWIREGARDN
jgi:hypothetical protein